MIVDALRYPVSGRSGRRALLFVVGVVVAVALGVRYAVALGPAPVALVPATGAGVAQVLLFGYLSRVLVDEGVDPPNPSPRAVVRPGAVAIALAVGIMALPTAFMLATVLLFAEVGATPDVGGGTLFLAGSTGALVLFLAAAYVLPVAVVVATRSGRLRAVVDADALLAVLGDPAYLVGWTAGFPLLLVGTGLAAVTVGSRDVAGVLSAVAAAYLLMAGARVVGEGYRATDVVVG